MQDSLSIGDFAMGLVEEEIVKKPSIANKKKDGLVTEASMVDVSLVETTKEDTNLILENAFGLKKKPTSVKKETPDKITEEYKNNLKEKYNYHYSELKNIINEMTTCGMIGVNMAGSQVKRKRKKRNG